MRYGVYVPCFGPYGNPSRVCDLAVAAEAAGWDGFFMWDTLILPPPVSDPWVTLGAVARETSTITLGPLVVPLPRRRPQKLALEAGTLQRLSGGRAVLGVGLGVPDDYTRFGERAEAAERISKLEDGLALLRSLLSGVPVDHDGPHYRADGVEFTPADIPVWVSGFWPRKRPFHAARGADGLFPNVRDPDYRLPTPEEARTMREQFVAAGGRPDGDFAMWAPGAAPRTDEVNDYAAAGVTWWLADGWQVTPDELSATIQAGPPR